MMTTKRRARADPWIDFLARSSFLNRHSFNSGGYWIVSFLPLACQNFLYKLRPEEEVVTLVTRSSASSPSSLLALDHECLLKEEVRADLSFPIFPFL